MEQGSARPLYSDSEQSSVPDQAGPVAYRPIKLTGRSKKRGCVLLFTIGKPGDDGFYEGTIEDPVPARHYAQMLLDAVEVGVTQAEVKMLHAVLGAENLRRLAQCEDLEPNDMINVMTQVADRAAGPYREAQGKL